MQAPELVLRDIHQPPAPPWWPPAPGWWVLFAVVLALALLATWWWQRRRRRRAAIVHAFDERLRMAATPTLQLAAISEFLRRAARARDAHADRLDGDAWLQFLDGDDSARPFSQGAGKLLLEGAYRRDADAAGVRALLPLARHRYMQLMAVRG